jgi:enoyl-CoA hydratase/carnithine racemase
MLSHRAVIQYLYRWQLQGLRIHPGETLYLPMAVTLAAGFNCALNSRNAALIVSAPCRIEGVTVRSLSRMVAGVNSSSTDAPRTRRADKGDVAVVEFIRPEARNALDRAMVGELTGLVDDLWKQRPGACVLIGTGSAFCAGGDLKERRALSKADVRQLRPEIVALFTALADSPVPIIAAVNGGAYGGGFELALACDFVIAAEEAVFALPEVGIGIIPAGGGTQNLVRTAGLPLAREIILLGRRLSAQEAVEHRIVRSVHPRAELRAAALAFAGELAARPRLAVLQARRAMRDAWGYDMAAALRHENELYDPCIDDAERDRALEEFASRSGGRREGSR